MATSFEQSGSRVASSLDTLLILSRSLSGAKQGGVIADALDLLLSGLGCARGAAYVASGDTLELVGERGLPSALRASLGVLPLTGEPWFAAQRAVHTRKLAVDRDLTAAADGRLARGALALARWGQVVACPITSGREVYGVLVFAWPLEEEPYDMGLPVIEIACNMMAIQMGRRRREVEHAEARVGDLRAERMAAVGILACGFAEDLDARLAEVGRRLSDPQRPPAEALRLARDTTARFLSAIRPSAPDRIELGGLVADVLALVGPHLRRRRIDVQLRRAGEHYVVGRRNELVQLFLQLVLRMAGVLDDTDEIYSDRSALIPRAFALEVCRQDGHEVVRLCDAGEDGGGARSSFFEMTTHAGPDLRVARRIVVAHEGHIEIGPSGEASGAHCAVVLPAASAERWPLRAALARRERSPIASLARPVVLWVDEDDLFLEIMVQSLHELDIRIARSAGEAAQLLAFGAAPERILCNIRLPDRPGHVLHAEVARQSRRVADRFIFVTDGVLTPEVASYLIASGRPTLTRPIDPERVKELLQREPTVTIAPPATEPTLAALSAGARQAPTVPVLPVVRAQRPPLTDPAEHEAPPAPAATASMRDQELSAISRAVADTLRHEGPKRGGAVLSMLRERGLSEPEALSVIGYAVSAGILVRDLPPASLLRAAGPTGPKTVLVVDDDVDLRHTLREVLQEEGYTVDTAANGKEALDRLRRSNPPRVMVLDLMMPVMDGWQLLEELKRDEAFSSIPVVVISAGKTGLRTTGKHEVLSKPLDYYRLVTTIDRSMRPLAAVP
jgi:CheY-like chemotaxis protein